MSRINVDAIRRREEAHSRDLTMALCDRTALLALVDEEHDPWSKGDHHNWLFCDHYVCRLVREYEDQLEKEAARLVQQTEARARLEADWYVLYTRGPENLDEVPALAAAHLERYRVMTEIWEELAVMKREYGDAQDDTLTDEALWLKECILRIWRELDRMCPDALAAIQQPEEPGEEVVKDALGST